MAKGARRPAPAPRKRKPFRPMFLAGGLGLIWFVEFQQGTPVPEGPPWSYAAVEGTRLLVDFVGAWLAVATVQLVVMLARHALAALRTGRVEREMS